jgi:hypothetical protein
MAFLVLNVLMVASAAAVIVWCISTDDKYIENWRQK